MVQFHRPGEASGHQKMSGFCLLSHKWPIQTAAGSISINGLPTWPALPIRQNDALCLINNPQEDPPSYKTYFTFRTDSVAEFTLDV